MGSVLGEGVAGDEAPDGGVPAPARPARRGAGRPAAVAHGHGRPPLPSRGVFCPVTRSCFAAVVYMPPAHTVFG
ncbi:hypothetical protein ACP70R_027128 [Stipagrostis hirtigluma subsp. patula]